MPFTSAKVNDPYFKLLLNKPKSFWKLHEDARDKTEPLSEEFKDLITRMMQPNPKKRITIAEIWEHKWMQIQGITKE